LERPPHLPPETPAFNADEEEAVFERAFRLGALPIALLLAFTVTASDGLRTATRIFCSMWLHELGHAVAAWLSGFAAFPGPWRTSVSETRSWFVALLLGVALLRLAQVSHRAERRALFGGALGALGAQLFCTLGLRESSAKAFITFSGDAGALVLGTVLMATLYAPAGSWLHRGALRWGFLLIGAFGFADVLRTWWAARKDWSAIPFGANEGVGLSDPTKLVETHGWSELGLVRAYLAVSAVCGVALVVMYVLGGMAAARRLREVREG
jgi:hypothetical protein